MADTIINTERPRRENSALGLLLAFIVLAALVVAGYFLYRNGAPGVPNTGSTNVNVTVPADSAPAPSNASGGLTGEVTGEAQ